VHCKFLWGGLFPGSVLNIVTLHRDAERHAYFATAPARPIVFEKSIDCWFVTNPRDAQALLRSGDLHVAHYAPIYESVADRSGYAFANLRFAFKHIPLCHDGPEHSASRRRLAEFLIARRAKVAPSMPQMVARRLAPLERSGEVDLMSDILMPLVSDLIGAVTETEITDELAVRRATIVFDRFIGLRKRIELDDEIGRIRAMIRRSHPDASEEDEGLRLALFVLGHDTLTGTLGETIFQVLTANSGLDLREIEFPSVPSETAVPFVERTVARSFEYAGIAFEQGQRLRIYLQPLVYSDNPVDRARLFGIGVHACLGRQLALDVWRHLTARIAQIGSRLEIVSHTIRTEDFVFTVPQNVIVRASV
jgi:cytochrome P450